LVNDSTAETSDANEAETEYVHWHEAKSTQKVARSNFTRLAGESAM
jgi:hypothetical protein